jgi:hypothetical protein
VTVTFQIGGGPDDGGPPDGEIDPPPGQCTSTGSRCITAHDSSCHNLPDGDYQACEGCTFYHSCVGRTINHSFRDCAATEIGGINGKLVWDDTLKRCEYESTTCKQCQVSLLFCAFSNISLTASKEDSCIIGTWWLSRRVL